MEADDGQLRGRHERDRRDGGLRAGRRIDHHERDLVLGEKRDRSLAILLVEPAGVAQLDGERRVTQPLPGLHDLVARLAGGEEPARVLQEDRAELAGAPQRLDAVQEARPDLVLDLLGQVARVDALLVQDLGRQRLTQILRKALDLARLAGHQRVGLDVEGEVRRRAFEPQLPGPAGGQRVVRRVDLHDRELVRVVDEPLLGRAGIGRVEHPRRRHRRIGPGGGADADAGASDRQRLARSGRVRVAAVAGDRGAWIMDVRLGHRSMLGPIPDSRWQEGATPGRGRAARWSSTERA